MQFLKTAFWVILAVAIALFSKANWDIQPSYTGRVPIKLWDDWILLVRLPVLIVAAFLLGLLPMWIFARVSRWGIRRRLQNAEQALAASIPVSTPATAPVEPIAPPVPDVSDAVEVKP
ncbi:MAG TPA: LapA family protein [Sphingobium sp.]|uniref:LapA family protein n=1 Tax=Sphingobium sp. TaxID=1912891 RepID=UPI002ED50BF9